jgi:hypothetical protein
MSNILDGEELVGAKQNRIVNVTILVAPQSEVVIPAPVRVCPQASAQPRRVMCGAPQSSMVRGIFANSKNGDDRMANHRIRMVRVNLLPSIRNAVEP